MGIRRACAYKLRITTPAAPENYSAMLVTFQQDQVNIINKSLEDLTIDGDAVVCNLTQEETKLFHEGWALVQARCFASDYDAPGSKILKLQVWPALDDTVLPGE